MNIVKVISTKLQESKRFVKFLKMGKDDVQECNVAQPFGVDSSPVKDMTAIYAETGEIGNPVIIGYINTNQAAEVGGHRIFSTDSDGVEQIAIYLRANGIAEIGGDADFLARFNELKDGFDTLRSDHNTLVTIFNAHLHPVVGANTGFPTVTGSQSTASIDSAKIDSLKCP